MEGWFSEKKYELMARVGRRSFLGRNVTRVPTQVLGDYSTHTVANNALHQLTFFYYFLVCSFFFITQVSLFSAAF